ncbi:sugar phosphate isomerase/epimerase family protein [Oscillibacter sp. GMB15532]|uniref:sugar phosphate isomerase/epimerase family protein n=1 Tax=Oscillibacter sp. GMB15532 TaxID=3230022 RepID=UPI0034DF25FF
MKQFSLAYLTVPGIDPLDQIAIAQDAGFDFVSLRTIPMGLPGEPPVCLERDPDLARAIQKKLSDTGMKLLDIELMRIREDLPSDYREAFEQGAKLGATQVLSSVWTQDYDFAVDRLGTLCEQANQFGLTVNLEFPAVSGLTTLADTVKIQDQVHAPNLKILVDMIYAYWDKVTPEDIRALAPERFGLIHLCDCPKEMNTEFMQVVREGRAYCGEGAVDIAGLLKALPDNPCSIELPNIQHIAELGAAGHVARCLETAKVYCTQHGL